MTTAAQYARYKEKWATDFCLVCCNALWYKISTKYKNDVEYRQKRQNITVKKTYKDNIIRYNIMTTAAQYERNKKKWAENPEAYNKEKKRINSIVLNKYHTDEVFRKKCIENAKARNNRLKALATTTATITE